MSFYVMECNVDVVVLSIQNISYTAISIKVVTEANNNSQMCNMSAKNMIGIIIVISTI
jgi:hypothetical protein